MHCREIFNTVSLSQRVLSERFQSILLTLLHSYSDGYMISFMLSLLQIVCLFFLTGTKTLSHFESSELQNHYEYREFKILVYKTQKGSNE